MKKALNISALYIGLVIGAGFASGREILEYFNLKNQRDLSGIILATGRVVGETAALIYTAGTVAQIPQNLFGSGRTLAIHMYVLSSEGLHTGEAFATAVVMLVMVAGINALADFAAGKMGGKNGSK